MTDPLSLLPRAIAAVAPDDDAAAWAVVLAPAMRASGIATAQRIAMFVGQCCEESNHFASLSEDLYYTAERMAEVWPSMFADTTEAAPYAGRPEALANRVYANRMGNGDEASGDGWRFRGRGLIQITGRSLYTMLAKADRRAADPDWLSSMTGAAVSACWFWTLPFPGPSLNDLSSAWNIKDVTRRINGGLTDYSAREAACEAALRAMDIAPVVQVARPEDEADKLMDEYD